MNSASKPGAGPRILLISEYPPPYGGMTVQAAQLLDALRDAGCAVTALRTNPLLPAPLRRIERVRGLRGLVKWLIFVAGCRRIFAHDLVHVFSSSWLNFYLFTLTPLWLARLAGKRFVINFHGGGARAFFDGHRRLLGHSRRLADALVVPSGFLHAVFADYGWRAEIIGNIAAVERFAWRERDPDPPVLISVRNLTPVYNVACTLRAFAILQRAYPAARLLLAGEGPERARLERLSAELGLEGVRFLGNLDNAELVGYYDEANLFINSSTVDNMPVSILEAFAAGLPVVSTDVGGIPYLVEHGESGLLAASDDHRALAECLLRLVRDPALARRLARNAHSRVQAYTRDKVVEQWLQCYARVADG